MEIWREDINAKGGLLGRPVEFVVYDDQGGQAGGGGPPRGAVPETHRTQAPGCLGKAVPARLTGTLAFSPPVFLGISHTPTPTAKRAGTPSLAIFASCRLLRFSNEVRFVVFGLARPS
jgi:hypothetical protein